MNNFEWIKNTFQFNENFIKKCNKESDEECFLEADVQYLENLYECHNDLPFAPERMKIEKLQLTYMVDLEYVIHIRNLKQALNKGWKLG